MQNATSEWVAPQSNCGDQNFSRGEQNAVRGQGIDATVQRSLAAAVWMSWVFRGLWFRCRATTQLRACGVLAATQFIIFEPDGSKTSGVALTILRRVTLKLNWRQRYDIRHSGIDMGAAEIRVFSSSTENQAPVTELANV